MQQRDAVGREFLRQLLELRHHGLRAGLQVGVLDARINDVGLASLGEPLADEGPDLGQFLRPPDESLDGPASRRQMRDDGDIEVAVNREAQRARDGRGGHHQQVRVVALAQEPLALRDAELVLLVNDDQAEALDGEGVFHEGVGADEELRVES